MDLSIIVSFLSLILIPEISKCDPDLTTLSNHVTQMEQKLNDLQSKSQVQEQKYATVLSSVLSKLTTTTDEMTALRRDHNHSLVRLEQITSDHNDTLLKLDVQLKEVQMELALTQSNLSYALRELEAGKSEALCQSEHNEVRQLKTDVHRLKGNMSDIHQAVLDITDSDTPPVYFQVKASNKSTVNNMEKLKFDAVSMNKGGGYDEQTGVFESPSSGVYLFWAHVTSYDEGTFTIRLYKDGHMLTSGLTTDDVIRGVATVNYITEVNKGDRIWFIKVGTGSNVFGYYHSYYVRMLLRRD